ncbi:branched-chain amino acid ABC transporter permease [Phytohabitans kaempferiae]|uniref:Branched-chain amino acid ABC transporter permease n=1 Tax=Phytohabitans kaempferiae TaxID=1620943 RepID=A0ABV6M5P8_9ACTN
MDWNIASGLIAAQMLWAVGLSICLRAGVFALGNLAFGLFGAYAGPILMIRAGVHWLPATLAAAALGALLAFVMGYVLRRLNEHFLAIGTIVLLMVLASLATGMTDFTGGAVGLAGIPVVVDAWIPTTMIVVITAAMVLVERRRWGHVLDIVGREPFAAESLGIRPARVRLLVLTISGALTAAGGSWFAVWYGFIDPNVIGLHNQLDVIASAVVGGFGNPVGPLVGTVVMYLVGELTREVAAYRDIVAGLIVIAFALLAPRGITSLVGTAWRRVAGPRVKVPPVPETTAPAPSAVDKRSEHVADS